MLFLTIMNPKVVFADEPTSALDVSSQSILLDLMSTMIEQKTMGSLVIITHDLPTLANIADRIAVMYAGQIVEVGTCNDIIHKPYHPYTSLLISSIIVPEKGIRGKKLKIVEGSPPDLRNEIIGCRFAPRCPYVDGDCVKEDIKFTSVGEHKFRCIKPLHGGGSFG